MKFTNNKSPDKKPELVSPAGDWPCLVSAVDAGADSVYFGVKGFNMRNFADNFDVLELKKIAEYLHKRDKKGYLTLNMMVKDNDLPKIHNILQKALNAAIDAVIAWDTSVISISKKLGLPIHLSTQACISNSQSLSFFAKLGVKRIIPARECTLEDIQKMLKSINDNNIKCEIETFIHGAMCISISGRCFLSSYSFGKSANKGECLQPCRKEYSIIDQEKQNEYKIGKDYILSAKDLCTIDFIDDLIQSGIKAFKIEGRTRSAEYVKVVTSVYRKAIDSFFSDNLNKKLKQTLKKQLSSVYNRGFSPGFYLGTPENAENSRLENTHQKIYIGTVTKFFRKINVAQIFLSSGELHKGNQLLFIGNKTPAQFAKANQMQKNHKFVNKSKKGESAGIKLPFRVRANDKVFIWKKKQE